MTAPRQPQPTAATASPETPSCPAVVLAAATRAHAALQDLARVAAMEAAGRGDGALDSAGLRLQWQPGSAPEDLAEEAFRFYAEAISEERLFRQGRVHCYACGEATCEHSAPPSPGAVCTGYESTGRPRWQEFFGYLLEQGG